MKGYIQVAKVILNRLPSDSTACKLMTTPEHQFISYLNKSLHSFQHRLNNISIIVLVLSVLLSLLFLDTEILRIEEKNSILHVYI